MGSSGFPFWGRCTRAVLLPVAVGLLALTTSCEDDPIVEPKGGTTTGGSYGGRLTQPGQPAADERAAATSYTAEPHNPEIF